MKQEKKSKDKCLLKRIDKIRYNLFNLKIFANYEANQNKGIRAINQKIISKHF